MQALAHNLPLLIMPMHAMLDQPMVAAVLQEQGAARTVRKSATPDHIRTAVAEMLASGPHRDAAARLGASIRARDGASAGADLISSLSTAAA
jgi:UDP:flavonoid glycosyltransferase YjiC (YdhE family)